MGYSLSPLHDNEIIQIQKTEKLVEIYIVFYLKDKKILGYMEPLKDTKYFDVSDMSSIYASFRNMKKDIQYFVEKSHYTII